MISRAHRPWTRHLTGSTPWHRTDPRVRLFFSILLSGLAIASSDWGRILLLLSAVLCVYCLSRTGLRTAWSGFRPFLFLLTFTAVLHLFFTPGRPLTDPGVLHLTATWEGLKLSAIILIRLSLAILVSAHLIATCSPQELSRSLGWSLAPAGRLGLPVADITLILNLGFQFFPVLLEESHNLRLALESRGISFRHRRLIFRLRALTSWILSLLTGVMERSFRLSTALELKQFNRQRRVPQRFPEWRVESSMALMISAVLVMTWFLL